MKLALCGEIAPLAYLPAFSLISCQSGRSSVSASGSPWPLCAFYHPEPSHRAAHWTARPSLSPDLLSERLWSLGVRPQPGGTLITGSALRYASLSPQQQINSTYLSLSPRSVRMEQLFMEQKGRGIMGDVPWLTAPFVFFGALRAR